MVRRLFPEPAEQVDLRASYAPPAGQPSLVRSNMVTSLDGATAVDGRVSALSNRVDQDLLHLLRSLADVVLVGASTIRAERYGPVRLTEAERQGRQDAGQSGVPPIAVVTRSGHLDLETAFFAEAVARPIVLTTDLAPPDRRRAMEEVAEVVVVGPESVDLSAGLRALRDRRLDHVVCEGGPHLLGQLVQADLLDELCLTVSPTTVGRQAAEGTVGRQAAEGTVGRQAAEGTVGRQAAEGTVGRQAGSGPWPMNLLHVLEDRGFLYLRYSRDRAPRPS